MSYINSHQTRNNLFLNCLFGFFFSFFALGPLILSAEENVLQKVVEFELPAGNLVNSLNKVSQQSGINLSVNPNIVPNKIVPEIKGSFTSEEILNQLLTGTGLTYEFIGSNTFTIIKQSSNITERMRKITVKGQLQERDLQDTQASVAVYTGDELDESTDRSVRDVLNRTANAVSSVGGLGYTIRGIEQNGVGGAGSGLLIDVNVDGASYVTSQGSDTGALSTWDLQQVEVLRGPQSTQQGRNALAGAISIRSKDPTFDQEFKTRFDGSSEFDEYRTAMALNVPLIEDLFAVRISAEQTGSDGFLRNITRNEDDYTKRDLQTFRGKLRFQPSEKLDVIFGHTYSDNRISTASINSTLNGKRRISTADDDAIEEAENDISNLRVSYDLNSKWSLHSETTYLNGDYRTFQDAGGDAVMDGNGERLIDDKNFTQEIRANFADKQISGAIGLYYSDIITDLEFEAITPGNLFGLPPTATVFFANGQDIDVENYAVFGEIDYKFNPNWTLTLGARYDYEERDETGFSDFSVVPPVIPGNITNFESDTDYDAFLPKVGLTYNWNEDVSLGFSVQRGYRSGGFSSFGTVISEFDEEYTTNYELSFRSTWMDNQLVANANVFYTDWEDQQVTIDGPLPGLLDTSVENAGESELYGFELETQYFVNDDFDLFFNIGYVETEFKEFILDGEDLDGNEFPYAPHWTGSVGGSYFSKNGFVAHVTGSYTDNVFEAATNDQSAKSESYFIVDARVGYESNHWSLFAYARNLFDKEYIERRRNDNFDTLGEPQVIGVQFSHQLHSLNF